MTGRTFAVHYSARPIPPNTRVRVLAARSSALVITTRLRSRHPRCQQDAPRRFRVVPPRCPSDRVPEMAIHQGKRGASADGWSWKEVEVIGWLSHPSNEMLATIPDLVSTSAH